MPVLDRIRGKRNGSDPKKAAIPYKIPLDHRLSVLPSVIWRVTTYGLIQDHRPGEIKRICQELKDTNSINQSIVWSKTALQYIVLESDDGTVKPLPYPDPKEIHTTPSSLYAKAVTYGKSWRRLLRRRLRQETDTLNKTSKMIWVGGLIVVVLFIVFVVIVSMIGSTDEPVAPGTGDNVERYGSEPDLTIPDISPSPTIPRGVKQ